MTSQTQLNVPFLDLSRELVSIKAQVQSKIDEIVFTNTNFILGNELSTFERNFANYITTSHCVGVANGGDAIEIAVNALGFQKDDEIITQSNTYVATCFGVTNNNITLKLVDINPNTFQMDLDLLEKNITNKTKAILIVHLTGSCCDMDRLMNIVSKHNLILIEDCAQSHGACYNGRKLGSFGLVSTFSFYPGKNLGAFGDGGAICSSDDILSNKMRKMRNNGSIEKYKHEIFGRNSRLDTLHAAVLDIKLTNLDANNTKRRNAAHLYHKLLSGVVGVQLPEIENNCIPVYHLFIIRTQFRDKLKAHLEDHNVGVGIHYPISISKLKCYDGYFNEDYPNAEVNCDTMLSLPMYPDLTAGEIMYVCDIIKLFFF
jgi:dTDP-4-amino-4,6-dideoxygalactose transaminase